MSSLSEATVALNCSCHHLWSLYHHTMFWKVRWFSQPTPYSCYSPLAWFCRVETFIWIQPVVIGNYVVICSNHPYVRICWRLFTCGTHFMSHDITFIKKIYKLYLLSEFIATIIPFFSCECCHLNNRRSLWNTTNARSFSPQVGCCMYNTIKPTIHSIWMHMICVYNYMYIYIYMYVYNYVCAQVLHTLTNMCI